MLVGIGVGQWLLELEWMGESQLWTTTSELWDTWEVIQFVDNNLKKLDL